MATPSPQRGSPPDASGAPGSLWRSTLFAVGLFGSAVVFAPLALLTFPLPLRARYGFIRQWSRLNLWWLARTCRLDFVVEGAEHIPPTAAVVMCKHQSAWETLALQGLFRPQVWVLKRELLRIPFFGWGLSMLQPIAIDRGAGRRAMEQVVREGTDRLRRGAWVVIFPEGTRVAPGERGRYHIGGAILAERAGTPVVPVAHNAGEYWPRRSFRKRPGTIRLVIGPPIPSANRRATEVLHDAETWIEDTVARLSGPRPPAQVENAP